MVLCQAAVIPTPYQVIMCTVQMYKSVFSGHCTFRFDYIDERPYRPVYVLNEALGLTFRSLFTRDEVFAMGDKGIVSHDAVCAILAETL